MYAQTENQAIKRKARWLALIMVIAGIVAFLSLASTASATGNGRPHNRDVREVGIAFFAQEGECTDNIPDQIRGNDHTPEITMKFTGALDGCLYTYVDQSTAGCFARADGTASYYEEGNEYFVGTYTDEGEIISQQGTLKTEYWYEATFPSMSDCENFTNQIDGGCVHDFIRGSGTGVFKRARGAYSIVDNVVDGVTIDFPYILELTLRR
ncbi:MAG: hypothetical protein KC445_20530 [Anaerolineales bacterium]|nr:hypothetical protein [Anaerolineales bacterium]